MADVDGASSLWLASRGGHETVVKHLLDQGVCIDVPATNGQTPLSIASQLGHVAITELLLKHGAEPDPSNGCEKTPLLFAAANGHLATFNLLLRFSANIFYKTSQGDTAMSLARLNGHENVADAIKLHLQSHMWNFQSALREGRLAEIERFISVGTDPGGYDEDEVPIIIAASRGQTNSIKTLIEYGADVDQCDYRGITALQAAAYEGYAPTVKLLHKYGAKIGSEDSFGADALSKAASMGHLETTRLLLDLGANSEWKDNRGATPLWWAAYSGQLAIVELLLVYGADIESSDEDDCTPLMAAVKRQMLPVAKLLIENGAQERSESCRNYSLLCYAADNGDVATVDFLICHGSDLDHLAKGNRTALHIAALKGHDMIIKKLVESGANFHLKDEQAKTALSLAKEVSDNPAIEILSHARSVRQKSLKIKRKFEQNGQTLYRYQPLSEPDSIRIIELHPGRPGDILNFHLHEVQLGMNPSFEALSYEWLAKVGTIPVQCHNGRLFVTSNCKAAMERLRLDSKSRYLWIDAICIDQANVLERRRQVAIMKNIYESARAVLMWLGEELAHTSAIFAALPDLEEARGIKTRVVEKVAPDSQLLEAEKAANKAMHDILRRPRVFDGYIDLLERTYWTRAWIYQEIMLAGSRGLIICGRHQCQWTVLKQQFADHLGCSKPSIASAIQLDDSFQTTREMSFYDATKALYGLHATDPRDKIFASLALVSNQRASMEKPIADYTMTVQQVYVYAARYLIDVEGIYRAWEFGIRRSTKAIQDIPSWVPDFALRYESVIIGIYFKNYILSTGHTITERPVTTASSLYAHGCIVDKVIFKLTLTQDLDTRRILSSVILAFEEHGRTIYGTYPVGTEDDCTDLPDISEKVEDGHWIPRNSNAVALFLTMMEFYDPWTYDTRFMISNYRYRWMIGYLTWILSQDDRVPDQSSQAPDYAQKATEIWLNMASDATEFKKLELRELRMMEDMLLYDHDLVYTEKGFFGLVNSGEAEVGMMIALIDDLTNLCLLNKVDGKEDCYEYVDKVFLNFSHGTVHRLTDIYKDIRIECLELC